MDFPLIALRRLLLVEPLIAATGDASLRESGDERVKAILQVERELAPTLKEIVEGEWKLIASKKEHNVQTFLRMGESGRANIKVVGEIPHKLASCLAPLLHPELLSTWLPGVGMAEKMGQASNFRYQCYIRAIKIPFLSTRDCFVTGYGDIYSPTSIMCYLTSEAPVYTEAEKRAAELSPEGGGFVRMEITGGFCFEILSSGAAPVTRISAVVQLDIKMKMIPVSLIDWFMKNFAAQLIPMYHKQASKFDPGGKLEELMERPENAPTYAELKRRLAALAPEHE